MRGEYPPRLRAQALHAAASAQRLAAPVAYPEGPDVSYAQPNVDWPAVRAGRDFAIARASYGLAFADDQLRANRPGMRAQDFALWGTYHFGRPNDPGREARYYLALTPDLNPGEARWLDAEVYSGWGPDADWCVAFGQEVRRLAPDDPLALYVSWSYWEVELGQDDRLLKLYDWLHVAAYGHISPFGQVPKCRMWQFTNGSTPTPHETPGVGRCDSSYFDGSVDQLRALVGGPAPGPASRRHMSFPALLA